MKSRIQISFINSQGLPEAGIDGGGVFKEFLTCLTKEAFDVDAGLFVVNEGNLLFPNPMWYENGGDGREYEFLGRVLGKAL